MSGVGRLLPVDCARRVILRRVATEKRPEELVTKKDALLAHEMELSLHLMQTPADLVI